MLHYVYANDLHCMPEIADGMYKDRKRQFIDRLGWDLKADANGWERDQYDAMNPLYVICTDAAGHHVSSIRILPTTGSTMVEDHFSHLVEDSVIQSPVTWEATRFCIAPEADMRASSALLLGGLLVGQHCGIEYVVGVFDRRMAKVYARLGWAPSIIGSDGTRDGIAVGLWTFDDGLHERLAERAGITDLNAFIASANGVISRPQLIAV